MPVGALKPFVAVALGGPVAGPVDPHLLGRSRLPGQPQQVPAAPQRRTRRTSPQRLRAQALAEPPLDRQPYHQQAEPEPPAKRRQHHAGEDPGEPIAERRDQRHRRARGPAAEQLPAGRGQLLERRLILQVLDPDRRAHRADQAPLHLGVHARGGGGGQGVLDRAAHQRQP